MKGSVITIGSAVVVTLGLIADTSGTMAALVAIITVRGVTFILKKLITPLNPDATDIIDFTGWGIASLSCVKVIKNAIKGVEPVGKFFKTIGDGCKAFGSKVEGFVEFMDALTFWN